MSCKIGLLVPNSNFISHLSRDLTKALSLPLDKAGSDYEITIETGGFNAEKQAVTSKIQDLIIKQQVDIVVAPLNVSLVEDIRIFCEDQEIPAIIITLGEDTSFHYIQSPFVFIHSLRLWQSAWLTGWHISKTYGENIGFATCMHSAGYGTSMAIGLGIEAAKGNIQHTIVTHTQSRDEDCTEQLEDLNSSNLDAMVAHYASKEALSFWQTYTNIKKDGGLCPLMAMPFLVDEHNLAELGEDAVGIQSISSWSRQSEAYEVFAREFAASTGHQNNVYTLLAYEAGLFIAEALKQASPHELHTTLLNTSINSPRGELTYSKNLNELNCKQYLKEVAINKEGELSNNTLYEISAPDLCLEQEELSRLKVPKQGWTNPYLIA